MDNLMDLGLSEHGGKIVVSSRDVARVFEKEHARVMRDIRELRGISEQFRLGNFAESSYTNEQNREMPQVLLTRDGFTIVVMGYNGESAMRFKEAYITAFNEMESRLASTDITINNILENPDFGIQLLTQYKAERDARLKAEEDAKVLAAEKSELARLNNGLDLEVEGLKVELNDSERFWTIAKLNQRHKLGWDINECKRKGKEASRYSRQNNYEIRKCQTNDERFEATNSYLLEEVLKPLFLMVECDAE
jgi:Rha family phage regulatory protein